MRETAVNQTIAKRGDPSKKHTVVLKKTSRGIFENVQCFFKNVQCFFKNNGMFLEAESEVQKPGLNHRKGMPQVKGYFSFFADSKNTSA